MKQKIIPCQVRCEQVLGAGVVAGAAGSGNDSVLQLEFGPMWEGLVKYVSFRNALKEDPVTVILTTDMMERILVPCGSGTDRCGMGVPGGSPSSAPFPPCGGREGQAPPLQGPGAAEGQGPAEGQGEGCPCREVLVYNVPIPPKAKAIAGQMGVVVQGYAVAEDGSRIEGAVMTANAYYKILPADYAPVEDGSVTPTLSQQLQGEIEKIKGDIVEAARAADAKEAAQAAAKEADRARDQAVAAGNSASKAALDMLLYKSAVEKSLTDIREVQFEARKDIAETKILVASADSSAASAAFERQRAEEIRDEVREKAGLVTEKAEQTKEYAWQVARDLAASKTVRERVQQEGELLRQALQTDKKEAFEALELEKNNVKDLIDGVTDEATQARDEALAAKEAAETAKQEALSAKKDAEYFKNVAGVHADSASRSDLQAAENRGRAETALAAAERARDEAKAARDSAVKSGGEAAAAREKAEEVSDRAENFAAAAYEETKKVRTAAEAARDEAQAAAQTAQTAAQAAQEAAGTLEEGRYLETTGGALTGLLDVYGAKPGNNGAVSVYKGLADSVAPEDYDGPVTDVLPNQISFFEKLSEDSVSLAGQGGDTIVVRSTKPDNKGRITNLKEPEGETDAATMGWVKAQLGDISALLDAINGEVI